MYSARVILDDELDDYRCCRAKCERQQVKNPGCLALIQALMEQSVVQMPFVRLSDGCATEESANHDEKRIHEWQPKYQ